MNILFLTIVKVSDISERGIYTDLIRQFRDEGHSLYVVCPTERRYREQTHVKNFSGISVLNIRTLNIQKTSFLEKGLATIMIERQFLKAIKQHFSDIKFDLIIYSTPPITFCNIIRFIKQRDKARSYLLLKDIFPQNAVDLGLIKKGGLLHSYFRKKEEELYSVSDHIGCMSPANVSFVLDNNKNLDPSKIEVNPNSLSPLAFSDQNESAKATRMLYEIPLSVSTFIYGGNLGKPQGIDFLISILKANQNNRDVFFVIVGSGTEFPVLKQWIEFNRPRNVMLLAGLQKDQYDKLVASCDVGLIFLDKRFTIPNFPSRLLSYLECKIPIVAATDMVTDIGRIAASANFGMWCESGDVDAFNRIVNKLAVNKSLREEMGNNGYNFMMNNYLVKHSYDIIMKHNRSDS